MKWIADMGDTVAEVEADDITEALTLVLAELNADSAQYTSLTITSDDTDETINIEANA